MSRHRKVQIEIEESAISEWFTRWGIPRVIDKRARWHMLPTDADADDPSALVECADGSVFTRQDVFGDWS